MQPFFWHLTLLKGTLSVILLTILSLPFIPKKNYGNSNFIIIVIPQKKSHLNSTKKLQTLYLAYTTEFINI